MAGLPDVIRSVLIANRGEVAIRIARACRALGLRSIAVYSDADAGALHVRSADQAIRIGPPEAARSYLDRDRLVAAALETQADAIHPGYGFLAEDATFARMVRQAGLELIGPSPDCIERMGSKSGAKAIAQHVGVPVVPGYSGADQSDQRFAEAIGAIGLPVLIKASAGGGGRGMRVVRHAPDLGHALTEARREAQAFFGDPTLLIEKLIEAPRHIEVQVAGDRHGGIIHLFERDCSIQRRHQKVIEEAPASRLPPAVLTHLLDDAVKVARAVGYDSIGTVEFLVDATSGEHWFLEMNTRLQVEHPVTELVTGIDLVALQIRLATGERLPFAQQDVTVTGSAIEARVCAEDPAHDYRPGSGTIELYHEPRGPGVRIDSGFEQGSTVSPYYDSLLAKVIASGPDRASARDRLAQALGEWTAAGVVTNAAWLADIVRHPGFDQGALTTRYLETTGLDAWHRKPLGSFELAALAALAAAGAEEPAGGPWGNLGSWRLGDHGSAGVPLALEILGERVPVAIAGSANRYVVRAAGTTHRVAVDRRGPDAGLTIDDRLIAARAVTKDGTLYAHLEGRDVVARLVPRREASAGAKQGQAGDERAIVAPLPGVIASVGTAVGQALEPGDVAVVMEAMKLVHSLRATRKAKVRAVHVRAGMTVSSGQVLVELD